MLELLEGRFAPAVFTVNTTADNNNAGSLRWAITQANANAGSTINFQIGAVGSQQSILLDPSLGPLPAVRAAGTVVNGYSQNQSRAGGTGSDFIEVNGGGIAGVGLDVEAGGVLIEGLAIDNLTGSGVWLDNPLGSAGDQIVGCNIGCGLNGTSAGVGNTGDGVEITGANNIVGDPNGNMLTVISGNGGNGVNINGATPNIAINDQVVCCDIGVDATGLAKLPNAANGVLLQGGTTQDTIGGPAAGTVLRNVISGNGLDGVFLRNASVNKVMNNYIGVGNDGKTELGNGIEGVVFDSDSSLDQLTGNVISANGQDGVEIVGNSNTLSGNNIGTDASGTSPVGNIQDGILVTGKTNNIGVAGSGQAGVNVISGNGTNGIDLDGAVLTTVVNNYIGTDVSGNKSTDATGKSLQNGQNGVLIENNAQTNTIGGTNDVNTRNVISNNGLCGIKLTGTDVKNEPTSNFIQGNFIGVGADGKTALGNQSDGVFVEMGIRNTIGGGAMNAGNVISANGIGPNFGFGVRLGAGSDITLVQGNIIGLDFQGNPGQNMNNLANKSGPTLDQGTGDMLVGNTTN